MPLRFVPSLRLALLSAVALAAGPAAAQISEADRLERCANNREALARLDLEAIGPVGWDDEKIARARVGVKRLEELLVWFRSARDQMRWAPPFSDLYRSTAEWHAAKLLEVARDFDIFCIGGARDLNCAEGVKATLHNQIIEAELSRPRHAEIVRQREKHRTNLIALGCDQLASGANAGVAQASQWMTGTFDSTFGAMTFGPGGGSYDYYGGRLSVGSVNGSEAEGIWEQTRSGRQCPDGRYWGRYRFQFSAGGFSGSYDYCGTDAGGGWSGTRKSG